MAGLIVALVFAVVVLFVLARTIRIVPQARAGIVERLGRYSRTLDAGLAIIVPFVDRLKPLIDLRETVVSFPPQPVITEDNLVVNIDTVIYFQVTDPKSATYEIADYIGAIEQLTVTTLRNVIGGMTLEDTLTSRDQINAALRTVLDEATGKWGIRVNRVELKAVDPPATIQEAMEKQMRAERDKRAAILTAEGYKQSQILTAEGEKQSAILKAEGARESQILTAEGQSKAIETVFDAIHRGDADPKLLAYQYLQVLPQIAQGESNKVWIIPSEVTQALSQLSDGWRRRSRRSSACRRWTSSARFLEGRRVQRGLDGADPETRWHSPAGQPAGPQLSAIPISDLSRRSRSSSRPSSCLPTAAAGRDRSSRQLDSTTPVAWRSSLEPASRMFDSLSEKLQATLSDVRSRGKLTEDDVAKAMRAIRLALLEADVNLAVVKQFTGAVKERALGQDVLDVAQPRPAGREDRGRRADRADGRGGPRARLRARGRRRSC